MRTPLDSNLAMVAKAQEQPTYQVPHDYPLLGFCNVVAPLGKVASSWDPGNGCTTILGNVYKLLRGGNATAKMAPTLHSFVRQILEGKKVPLETINTYLKERASLARYNLAFQVWWALCSQDGVKDATCSIEQAASYIIKMASKSLNEARNAYSALTLVPGLDQIKFCTLLQP